jgi:hypothetical protein
VDAQDAPLGSDGFAGRSIFAPVRADYLGARLAPGSNSDPPDASRYRHRQPFVAASRQHPEMEYVTRLRQSGNWYPTFRPPGAGFVTTSAVTASYFGHHAVWVYPRAHSMYG